MKTQLTPEERYLLDFDTRALPRYATDVLVIGGGIAGLSAALAASEHARVLLVLKSSPSYSNTAWAQGGIAAAMAADDTAAGHAADTIRTGAGLCDERVVREVAGGAVAAVERLVSIGAAFDRTAGEDSYALGREAGHSARRILHKGDATGIECSRSLFAAVSRTPGIHVVSPVFVVDLLTARDRCVGALVRRRDGELFTVSAKAVVLAAGGAGRLYRETSNVRDATGDGIAAAFRAGADLRDVEFVQFHPTTLYLAGTERVLVTEAVRGEGAHVVDNHGRRFLEKAHEAAELAPRDIVSRAIVEHLARPDVTDVFLDLRHWPQGQAARRFPGLARVCTRYGLDPATDRIPVRPAAHYFIGGVACDLDGLTSLPGLFACGEAACSGMHGANRLASNSLLEGLVLGTRAGSAAAMSEAARFDGDITHRAGRDEARAGDVDVEDLRKSLASRLWRTVGVVRDAGGMAAAADAITRWRHFLRRVPLYSRAALELENLLLLGVLVTGAAIAREESRGTHGRRDFRERDDDRFLGSFFWSVGAPPRFKRKDSVLLG